MVKARMDAQGKLFDERISISSHIPCKYPESMAILLKLTAIAAFVVEKYTLVNDQNYALVTGKYLQYLKEGNMPDWEVSGMIAK